MTETDQKPASKPKPASPEALTAADKLAAWCVLKRNEALQQAKSQIYTVWWLLLGGIVLLLVLPRVVAFVDYTGGELPPETVKAAEATIVSMQTTEAEMKTTWESAQRSLAEVQDEREDILVQLAFAHNKFDGLFRNRLSVWEEIKAGDRVRTTDSFADLRDGSIIVGARGTPKDSRQSQVAILQKQPNESWTTAWPQDEGEPLKGFVGTFEDLGPKGILALGSTGLPGQTNREVFILIKRDRQDWSRIDLSANPGKVSGAIFASVVLADGTILAVGYEQTDEGDKVLALTSQDGQSWTIERPESDGVRIEGWFFDVEIAPDGKAIAVGRSGRFHRSKPLIMTRGQGSSWDMIEPPDSLTEGTSELFGITKNTDGLWAVGRHAPIADTKSSRALIVHSVDGSLWTEIVPEWPSQVIPTILTGISSDRSGIVITGNTDSDFFRGESIVATSSDGKSWTVLTFEANGSPVSGQFWRVHRSTNGKVYTGGVGARSIVSAPGLVATVREAFLEETRPPGAIVLAGSATAATETRNLRRELRFANDRLDQSQVLSDQARSSYQRQTKSIVKIQEANEKLEEALRLAEPVRQASWIATRLAVVALIMFLVTIAVNRYRYLQRLADFYEGRAQAFRMLAEAGPEAAGAMLHDVSLNDLLAGLSPDAIGFGRQAELPTQPMMTAVTAALKR